MSSGVEAEIALDAAVVASLGTSRLLGAGAGAGAKGAAALGRLAGRRADERAAALAEAERYERALREVVDRNARVRALAETQKRARDEHGAQPVPVPAELPLTGQPYDELVEWCAAVDGALDAAERSIAAEIAAVVTAKVQSPPDRSEDLARVLARLLPDASAADHVRVREAAEKVAQARSHDEAETLLSEVRVRVQDANRHVSEERARLKQLAEEQDRLAQAEAERQYVLDTVTSAFEELGYEVDSGFEVLVPQQGGLILTREEWPDQAVRMVLDDSTLRAKMLRTRPPLSEDDRRRDAERESEWCAAFESAKERLERDGLNVAITWRLEPGAQELPLGAESARTRKKQKPRERRLEH